MRKESITEKNISPAITGTAPWRLIKVKACSNYTLEVMFIDGTQGVVEMKSLIMSSKAGVFAKLRDINTFNQVYLEFGVASWPGEIDLAPDAMHDEISKKGKWILK